jgi:adenylate cyclase, class 2
MSSSINDPYRIQYQMEIEKKYKVPSSAVHELRHNFSASYGSPNALREEDFHGFTNAEGNYLRLRRSGTKVLLIAKGPTTISTDGIRSRQEVEVGLTPEVLDQARDLVQLLCTEKLPAVQRERLVWKIPEGGEVVMDFLDALPDDVFVEVEVLGTDQDAALEKLRHLEHTLGLNPEWQETRSYARILQDQGLV